LQAALIEEEQDGGCSSHSLTKDVLDKAVAEGGAYDVLHARLQANAQVPERCDEQLSRLLGPLEELKSQFGDQQQFLGDILSTREEWLATFGAHKQVLLDERLRKAQGWLDAARRILQSLGRRTARLTQPDELNALFAADPLTLKRRELAERLRELKGSVNAKDGNARLKAALDQVVFSLRDKNELFEAGGNVSKLGPRHRFSGNTQALNLTLMPRDATRRIESVCKGRTYLRHARPQVLRDHVR
jgi:hypothetical protein